MARLEIGLGVDRKELSKDLSLAENDINAFIARLNKKNISLFGKGLAKEIEFVRLAIEKTKLATAENRAEQSKAQAQSARLRQEQQALAAATRNNRTQQTAASGSYREAQQRLTALGKSIREAAGGFASTSPRIRAQITEYRQLNLQLRAFDASMANHQRNVGNYPGALNAAGDSLKGLLLQYLTFGAAFALVGKIVKANIEISDSLADVRRTAGLTAKEVNGLAEELKRIETRTSLKDLLGISKIGGQLGIAKDQLKGFTRSVDQLSVALGDELTGGAEGIAKSLGVLDNVFKVTANNSGDVEKSYNQIGSAILGLGQSGLATGDFLADFGERVGGVAKQAGIALPTILAYGAVLQENGVSAEVAGTAFKRLISALGSNSKKFFQVAKFGDVNLTLKEFSTLVNTDTKKALDVFFAGLRKGGDSTIAFNTILKDLKLNGSGVSQVVSALSSNQEALNKHIQDATKDFGDASLASDQFAIKNNNLAASVDKLSNAFTNISSNPDSSIGRFFKFLVEGATDAIKEIEHLINVFEVVKGVFTDPLNGNKAFKRVGRNNLIAAEQDRIKGVAKSKAKDIIEISPTAPKLLNNFLIEQKKLDALFGQSNYAKAFSKDIKNTTEQIQPFIKRQKDLIPVIAQQKALVDELARSYNALYGKGGGARSNSGVPAGFGKKPKTVKAPVDLSPRIDDIVRASNNSVSSGDSGGFENANGGLDAILEKTRQKYEKFYTDLGKLASKKGADQNKVNDAYALLRLNEEKETNAQIIADFDRLDKASDVNQEKRLKRLEEFRTAQNTLYSKLDDLYDKDFKANEKHTKKGTKAIDDDLKERLKKAEQYFNDLEVLYLNDPLMMGVIRGQRDSFVQGLKGNANKAKNPVNDTFSQDVNTAIKGFASNFIDTLSNLNQETDKTFASIFSSLSSSLISSFSSVFQNTLASKLDSVLSDGFSSLSGKMQGLAAGLGIAGGIISGSSSKTSVLGQGLGGGLSGAAAGLAIGSAVPGIGTAAGAIIGGAVGLLGGIFGASKAKKEEQIQKEQLEEQKKQTALLERQNALVYSSQIIGRQTVNGLVTGVEINEFGELTTKISGQDLQVVLTRANRSRQRGI